MTSFSGCVVPVGPRFEDPPAIENFPPTVVSSLPQQGMTVTVVNPTQSIDVSATDPNIGDSLYQRWLAEYPPYNPNSTFILKDAPFLTRAPGQYSASLTTSCQDPYPRGALPHTITLLVSDRKFWDPGDPLAPTNRLDLLTTNVEGTQMAEASWVLNLTCSN
jgi:hypothetical protein